LKTKDLEVNQVYKSSSRLRYNKTFINLKRPSKILRILRRIFEKGIDYGKRLNSKLKELFRTSLTRYISRKKNKK
jgi:hypothetical protein